MQYTNFHYDSDKEQSNEPLESPQSHKKTKKRKDSPDLNASSNQYSNYKQESKVSLKEPTSTIGDISQHAKDLIMKYEHQIHVDQLNSWGSVARQKDKASRATIQHTLDPRTLVILCKLIKNGILKEIRGCVATGKEANVLEAVNAADELLAIKVYRTSILGFKDRERYVNGEWRFRNGVCYSNPRKMIKIWAEKEFRNLKRMWDTGVCSPEPILVKGNIVVMKWVGGNEGPAKRLKDIQLEQEGWSKVYLEVLIEMWALWNECRLVHADLSEYNMLWWDDKVWVIDVAQSVEHDHPQAIQFLRMDCLNVNRFFLKKGVITFSVKQVFDLITDLSLKSHNLAEYLQELIEKAQPDTEQSENGFMVTHIPRTLGEIPIKQIEEDIERLKKEGINDNQNNLLYAKLAGIQIEDNNKVSLEDNNTNDNNDTNNNDDNNKVPISKEKKVKKLPKKSSQQTDPTDNPDKREKRELKRNKVLQQNCEEAHDGETYLLDHLASKIQSKLINQEKESDEELEESENSDNSEEDEEEGEEGKEERKKHGWTRYDGMSKQERKKMVKEEKREKRKNKIPKKVKKQLVKKTK